MKKSTLQNSNFQALSTDEIKEVKGGLRYITSSRSAFESKRNYLQCCGASMDIKVQNGIYCIEW